MTATLVNQRGSPKGKISMKTYVPRRDVSVFKLIRTDTTLDLSQKA